MVLVLKYTQKQYLYYQKHFEFPRRRGRRNRLRGYVRKRGTGRLRFSVTERNREPALVTFLCNRA